MESATVGEPRNEAYWRAQSPIPLFLISIRILAFLSAVMVRISVFGRYFGRLFCVFDTNFGQLYYYDKMADDAERHVVIISIYALSNL